MSDESEKIVDPDLIDEILDEEDEIPEEDSYEAEE